MTLLAVIVLLVPALSGLQYGIRALCKSAETRKFAVVMFGITWVAFGVPWAITYLVLEVGK